ncbi:methyltransferase domain-containing protein [Facklamia miroungae]|uniref:Arsenite methyltransferase n=1 Tax=Facklamia miroungae TaxID=120956 RepID=A0A1G7QQA1_9LACT|nr:methyltransferase domain-containing protein [Facklamia miroungae]NKZ29028.1 methyltransferase domain-containing protein [Facklamia miroungae]SDG00711.1 Methyltransferase domain-containing protein [Facklamia miroungae]
MFEKEPNAPLDADQIKKSVADFYHEIATDQQKTKVDTNQLNQSIGYSVEEIASAPEESNMGLGCGNPQEKAKPQPGETIVDLGCGKGFDAFIAAKAVGEKGRVIGVDMTLQMIQRARAIAQKRHFEQVDFRLGEIEHLPVADNTADLVISNCVINLSTAKQDVYNEIFRILKPGGRIGISDITLYEDLPHSVYENPKMYGT